MADSWGWLIFKLTMLITGLVLLVRAWQIALEQMAA